MRMICTDNAVADDAVRDVVAVVNYDEEEAITFGRAWIDFGSSRCGLSEPVLENGLTSCCGEDESMLLCTQ